MYGLLKTNRCHVSTEQKYRQRLHYCGTCKTMGRLFGQRARMLLNYDAVFLAELLSALAGTQVETWSAAYQSYNCLARPRSEAEMPLALQFAATANILLTEFKLADQRKDSGRKRWRMLQWVLESPFRQAAHKLTQWRFPLAALRALNDEQDRREAALQSGQKLESADAALRFAAAPTAQATAMFFEHGAKVLGVPQLSAQMAQLGADFGVLIYVLDALEDYEQDAATKEFNAIRVSYEPTTARLPKATRQTVVEFLLHLQDEIIVNLSTLPLPPAVATLFVARLRANLARKLEIKLPVIHCAQPPLSFQKRWQNAVTKGRQLMQQELSGCGSLSWLKAPFIFATVFAVAFMLPSQSLKSWREGLAHGVNLMFWGAVPGAILAAMPSARQKKNPKENQSSCWSSCDCCVCEGCDGCCECCGDGCCDSCGCDGCCDGCSCDC